MSESAAAGRSADGRSTRWDLHRRERRHTIVAAAIEAIEANGPDAVTAQIAELAGVPRTHVYRHFDGKQALDLAVSSHIANEIGRRVHAALATRGSVREIIAASIDEHLGWIEQHPNLYRFLAHHAYAVRVPDRPASAGGVDAKAAFAAGLTPIVERYLAAFGVDPTPAQRVIVGCVGLVDATAAWWLDARTPPRRVLTGELTAGVWALIERAGRDLGLSLDPDRTLPALGSSPAPAPPPDRPHRAAPGSAAR